MSILEITFNMKYIITETQNKRMFLTEHYPGTKKPMGADGVDEKMLEKLNKEDE